MLAVVIALVASRIGLGRWPDIPDYVTGDPDASRFPAVRVGWTSAVVATMLPDLARPMRRAARWILLIGASRRHAAGRWRHRAASSPAC